MKLQTKQHVCFYANDIPKCKQQISFSYKKTKPKTTHKSEEEEARKKKFTNYNNFTPTTNKQTSKQTNRFATECV